MKRLCAILLGLMMLAGLCACGRRTSPAPAPKTPEPVTVITPAQPTPSEAVPVSTPDGTTPLTAAELDWFGRCFFNVVPGWGPNRFLTCRRIWIWRRCWPAGRRAAGTSPLRSGT